MDSLALEKRIAVVVDAKVGQLQKEVHAVHEELRQRLADLEQQLGPPKPAPSPTDARGPSLDAQAPAQSKFGISLSVSGAEAPLPPELEDGSPPASEEVQPPILEPVRKQASEFDAAELHEQAVLELSNFTLEESIWDTIIFVGVAGVPLKFSFIILFSFITNLFWQVSFCIILAFSDSFVKDPYPDLGTITKWRLTTAHDIANMDTVTHNSLASRVCGQDGSLSVSTSMMSIYSEIKEYLHQISGLNSGPVLCSMVLLLWSLFIGRELIVVVRFITAVGHLPRSHQSRINYDGERYAFACIGRLHLPAIFFAAFMRAAIAVAYGWYGGSWLANTKSVEALVLNAAALCFVLDMDEIIFSMLLPPLVQHLTRTLQPLQRPKGPFVGVHIPLIVVGCAAYTLGMNWGVVQPKTDKLIAMNGTLCEGNLDFVFGIRSHTGEVVSAASAAYSRGNALSGSPISEFHLAAVEEMVKARSLAGLSSSDSMGEVKLLNEFLAETMGKTAHDWATCDDVAFSNASMPHHDAVLHAMLGGPTGHTCGDLAHLCTDPQYPLVRLLCPVSCGCRHPRSGLFLNTLESGCPRNKCVYDPSYLAELEQLPCEDPSPAALAGDPGWIAYWDQMAMVFRTQRSVAAHAEAMREAAMQRGCGILNVTMAGVAFIHFCHGDHLSGASLRPWCPVTCGCTASTAECPRSCPEGPSATAGSGGGSADHSGHGDHGATGSTGSSGSTAHGGHSGHGAMGNATMGNATSSGSTAHGDHGGHGAMGNASSSGSVAHGGHGAMGNSSTSGSMAHGSHVNGGNSSSSGSVHHGHYGGMGHANASGSTADGSNATAGNSSSSGSTHHSGSHGGMGNSSSSGTVAHSGHGDGGGMSGMGNASTSGPSNSGGDNASDPMANSSNASMPGAHSHSGQR